MASELMTLCGGATAIANTIGHKRQNVYAWITTGDIPHSNIYDVADALYVTPWTIGYHKLMQIFGTDCPEFKEVVLGAPLREETKVAILEAYNG